jgi:hypothetical protein
MRGNFLPDKEFRSSCPHIAMGLGPYLYLNRRIEIAGVWPLRIPDNATAAVDSLFARSQPPAPDRPPEGGHLIASCVRLSQTFRSRRLSP